MPIFLAPDYIQLRAAVGLGARVNSRPEAGPGLLTLL